jgi:hypothetical protein
MKLSRQEAREVLEVTVSSLMGSDKPPAGNTAPAQMGRRPAGAQGGPERAAGSVACP